MGELINTNDLSSLIPMSANGKGLMHVICTLFRQ